ncbi:para-nitrobenzyl esterase [Actinokineospora iranica]|uniref:Carboxylic ester hydrolase n=2 Tax=Actinokineospora iranica TaxID=1271860 RepID=A0A1G6TPK4_9PSEU|nr:para-nitrobenzyl esterase [Actinokineospora iranica]
MLGGRLAGLAAGVVAVAGLAVVAPDAGAAVRDGADDGVVSTDAGMIRGVVGERGRAFLGVPFAQAPVGELRWRAPQQAASWSGVRDTVSPGPLCAQNPSPAGGSPTGSTAEDCLYLNVYTPAGARPGADLPVMVWLHGGGFVIGGGSLYDPEALADKTNSVVVTTNYRLGALGFLALPGLTAADPALNFGIQDQQAALRWTRGNIENFGGDRDRVMLFGESAGAASVCVNLTSPRAEGLFHRAVMQSGACAFARPGGKPVADKYARSQKFAAKLGCPDGPAQIDCLRGKDVKDLLGPAGDENPLLSAEGWGPVVDGAVLPGDPAGRMEAGKFHRMPIMLGTNRDEGRLFTYLAYGPRGITEDEYRKLLVAMTGSEAAANTIAGIYSTQRYGTPVNALSAIITDTGFAFNTDRVAKAISGRTPTYAYEFTDADAPLSPALTDLRIGAYHGGEIQYLLTMPSTPLLNDAQRALSTQMMGYWGNFAATGNPNRGAAVPPWPAFNVFSTPYRNLNPSGSPATFSLGAYQLTHNLPFWKFVGALG